MGLRTCCRVSIVVVMSFVAFDAFDGASVGVGLVLYENNHRFRLQLHHGGHLLSDKQTKQPHYRNRRRRTKRHLASSNQCLHCMTLIASYLMTMWCSVARGSTCASQPPVLLELREGVGRVLPMEAQRLLLLLRKGSGG